MANSAKKQQACQLSLVELDQRTRAYYKQKVSRTFYRQVPNDYVQEYLPPNIRQILIEKIGEKRYKALSNNFGLSLRNIADFQDKWVRDIQDWQPNFQRKGVKLLKSLVTHLFVKYEIPQVMYYPWVNNRCDFIGWFFTLAEGYNIGYVSNPVLNLSKKMIHLYQFAPANLTPVDAFYWAALRGRGASVGLANMLLKTDWIKVSTISRFWDDAIHFFLKNAHLSSGQIKSLSMYFEYKRLTRQDTTFFPSSFSLAELIEQKNEWVEQMNLKRKLTIDGWAPAPFESYFCTLGTGNMVKTYNVVELRTGKELVAEGNAMRTCVADYKDRCKNGHQSIWSVREFTAFGKSKSIATICVNNQNRTVLEARGKANRSLNEINSSVIKEWCSLNKIRMHLNRW